MSEGKCKVGIIALNVSMEILAHTRRM